MSSKSNRFDVRIERCNRQGATIVLMLVLLVVVFLFVAFAIDLGRVQVAQLKLQVASDFAARAGAEAMSRGIGDVTNPTDVENAIRDEVGMLMSNNLVFGAQINFDSASQIEFGRSIMSGNKFTYTPTSNGNMDSVTNSLRVDPNLGQFPMMFGGFTGRDSIALNSATTAKVQDRDIVVVIDRSTSMLDHDAGTMLVSEYDSNLLSLEDSLYGSGDLFHSSSIPDGPLRHTEFEYVNGGTELNLSRVQALKLAILRFRQQIDSTRGKEQLGLVTYADQPSSPADVTVSTPTGAIDVEDGLSASVISAIIDNSQTETPWINDPVVASHEHTASALESDADSYDSFDFNYLRTRWCPATNIAGGISTGTNVLFGPGRRSFATPILIVMTDGRHNQESTPEAAATAAMAAHPDMLIYTITFGAGAQQTPMITVAATGNGNHFHADNANELVDVFEELASNAGVTVIE